jgi:FemAB-related protein (PEP-CTERM system-associated)
LKANFRPKSNNISVLTADNCQQWDDFVKGHQQGSFFHLSGWQQVISNSFKHPCYFLYICMDNKIVGVLPLVEVKSLLFGHALISTPFCVYGGAIANSPELVRQLEQEACYLAEQLAVDYLELRYQEQQDSTLILKQAHSTFGCPILESDEQILASVKKKQRAVIRHSGNNGLTTSSVQDKQKFNDFYSILSESYRNLGTPIFSKSFFQNLITCFAKDIDILVINNEAEQPSSAVMNFYFNEQVLPYYGGGNAEARTIKSADFMYYQVMCNARKKGFTWYDFGRSKNHSGAYNYKKNWGMQAKPLYYYYYLVNTTELPNLSPNNPKYKMFIKLWQKLPLKLSQFLGPFLSRYLG